ncbi:MAG: MBL fold metallo-hydrolase, partial [Verrucomicrobiales bacterium]
RAREVAVVGDALFAGSVGKVRHSYEAALGTLEREVFSLAEETVLLPGHGPRTRVGDERRGNAFFAGRI